MDYKQAKKIRDKSFGTLFAEQEGGFGQSLKSTISQKTKAKVTGIKETFDILNIAKTLTGGSNWAPAMLGKMIGSDKKRIDYFSGVKPKHTADLESSEASGSLNSPESLESLGYIYKSLKQSIDDRHEKEFNQKKHDKKEEDDENTRNEELVKALTARRKKKEKPNKTEPKKSGKEEPTTSKSTTNKTEPKKDVKEESANEKPIKSKPSTTKVETPTNTPNVPKTSGVSTTSKVATGVSIVAGGTSALLSENALARIKTKEGFVEKAYFDPKVGATRDLYSVGHGHQITDEEIKKGYIQIGNKKVPVLGNDGKNTLISKSDAGELLKIDYKKYEDYATTLPNFGKLNMNAQVTLVDMTYNMGVGWAKGWPVLLNQLQNLDLEGAASNIEGSRYIKQVGKRGIESANFIRNGLSGFPPQQIKPENNLGNQIDNSSKENKNLKVDASTNDKAAPVVNSNTNNQNTQQENSSENPGNDKPAYLKKVKM